jgi:hypothetical protein
MEHLKRRFPDEIWPRKILAEVFHENLAPFDTAYFGKSYEVMEELRRLAAYNELRRSRPDDYRRVESDYLEVAFTASHFTEVDSLTERILVLSQDTTDIFNAALFAYFSSVIGGDRSTSLSRLTQLESIVRSFPEGFTNNWAYPGTTRFIGDADLPRGLRVALGKLIKSGHWYRRAEASAVFAENRNALRASAADR